MNDSAGGAGARRLRGRLQFLLLAVLFFGPLLAAYVMYFYMPHPQAGTNYGELVLPTRPTDGLSLIDAQGRLAPELLRGGRWSLVLLAGRDCNEPCLQRLVMTTCLGLTTEQTGEHHEHQSNHRPVSARH